MRVRPSRRRGRDLPDEAGMTLIEVMIAMLLLTVVLSALAGVLITSLRALHGNETRARANALANEVLEDLQGRAWEEVGFLASDAGFRADFDGEDTVVVDSDDAGGAERPLPQQTVTRDGIDYDVRTDITWVDDAATGTEHDYKRFRVSLSWTDLGQARDVTHAATRAPSPAEQEAAEFAIGEFTVAPEIGLLKNPGDSDLGKLDAAVRFDADDQMYTESVGSVALELRTTAAADDAPTVEFVDRDGTPRRVDMQAASGDDSGTHWVLEGSNTDGWRFRNGDTAFRVIAERGDQQVTATQPARYVYPADQFAFDQEPEPSETWVCVDADRVVAGDVTIDLSVHGATVDDRVAVSGAGLPAGAEADFAASTDAGADFTASLPAGHQIPDGAIDAGDDGDTVTLAFDAERSFDSQAADHTELTLDVRGPDHSTCASS